MSETTSEVSWISAILNELGVPIPSTPELYCDNLSAVMLTANPTFHARTKHFELDHHYVREQVALGTLVVNHIPAHQQLADIFTKSLPYEAFSSLRYKLGVDVPSVLTTTSLRGDDKATSQDPSVKPKLMQLGRELTKPKPEHHPRLTQRSFAPTENNKTVAEEKRKKQSTDNKPNPAIRIFNKFDALGNLD